MLQKSIFVDGRELRLVKVESITRGPSAHVFDLEIANVHNYYAEGINVHNCDYHAMLRHYSNVYGEKLFKLNDSYVDYRARSLFWHPMSPDLRIMRGRCARFATILNTNGGFYHAGELIKKDGYHKVKNMTIDSHVGQQEVSHTYKDRSETIKVKTRNGYSIEGTPEHPMLVLTPNLKYKWVPLDEMKVGDWIVSRTPKNAPMFGTNDSVSKDMATIMGYYVANGHKNFIASSDDSVIKNMYAVYNRITGCTPTFCIGEGGVRSHTHYLQLERQGVFVRDYLRPLGITSKTSLDKFIPLSIRTAPFEVFHEFMEAYFECDSGVNGGGDNGLGSTRPHEIEVGSASYKLAYQLHVLLLHAYGIVGRLQKQVFFDKQDKKTGLFNAKRTHWIVSITGYDAGLFLRTFKRAKVQKYRDFFNNTPAGFMSDRRSVPYLRKFALSIYDKARLGKRFVREDGSIYSPRRDGKLLMPAFVKNHRPNLDVHRPLAEFAAYGEDWEKLTHIMDQFDGERTRTLRTFLANEAHYEEVTEITFRKKKSNVYDVTVPGTHAFTANGLVSHNTRVAACYAANTLVSTDKGLIRIDDSTLVGMNAIRGSHPRPITNWSKTKWATNVIKVKLENGMELSVTDDHKVLAIGKDLRTKRVDAGKLKGRYVGVTLGGEFPEELELVHDYATKTTTSEQYIRLMCEMQTFQKAELLAEATRRNIPKLAGINSVMAQLAQHNAISKRSLGCRMPSVFTIEKSVEDCVELLRGVGVQTQRKFNFVAPLYMTEELAYVLGCMVADGSYTNDHEFTYATSSFEKAEYFANCMGEVFNVELRIAQYETVGNGVYYRVNMGTKEVKRFFRYLGLAKGSVATNKTIPWSILEAPRNCVTAFLNAGFITDGGMHNGLLYYRTSSPELAKHYQMLLARCGYYTKIRTQNYISGKCKDVHKVELSPDSTHRFLKYEYEGMVKRKGQNYYSMARPAGANFGAEFDVPYSSRSVRAGYGKPVLPKADPNIVWVRVKEIEELENQWVYDISVGAKDEMFTANGVVAKNSIDEIAYFDANKDNQKVTISGHEIYDALANSLATVRTASEILLERGYDDVFPAYMMNVTSPVSKADMIHVIIERAKGSRSIFAVTRPTWEVNPNFKRNSQFIMEQYRRDPISADRNFGANPPAIANPFIANHKMIQDCEGTHKNTIKVSPVFKKAKVLGQGYMYGEVDKIKKSGKASLVAIDAGVTNNSFALAVGSTDGYNLSVDLLAEIIPVPGYPINFTKMYDDLILPIMQARNAKVLLADRWNSRMLLDTAKQDMADIDADEETFIAEQYSLKYIDMVGVRTCMEMGILKFPKSELDTKSLLVAQDADFKEFYKNKPVAHLFKQLYTIKDLTNGVGKGDGYTDDLWRATALLVHGLQSEKYQMLLSQENFDAEIAKPVALGASKLYSGGGGQIGQGGGGQTIINGAPLGVIKRR